MNTVLRPSGKHRQGKLLEWEYMELQNIFGLLFDPSTGKVTLDDGTPPACGADFTFESHRGYNPLQYATPETCAKLVSFLRSQFGAQYNYAITSTQVSGPVAPPPQQQIVVSRGSKSLEINSGLLANSIIRSGPEATVSSLKADGLNF